MLHENILMVRDENGLGTIFHELRLSFDRVEVSVRDVITERVIQEVARYNQSMSDYRHNLVQPTEVEQRLNGVAKQQAKVNVDKQIAIALKAFESNGFFILVDDSQVDDLDEVVTIKPQTQVSFIKLTPLVGG